ncbi:enoyl-CoA hydratase/isomerase family protein [Burkholderia sp. Ac-20353]|uniref:enoyl-CoA hydratase/isomerase family protein n=1 Tax=Burkholderia sp. Ac-20353 TaxID=2703894 RepID=UPI00197B24C2|nr:enoyl-CoA hydratase/isomerase family protein [Burkholderia sp. Ac-20353]MBN3788496.1 enoyl-CoA hydratase/isomerase family protein [Burkholderia sp. Ac-20353]
MDEVDISRAVPFQLDFDPLDRCDADRTIKFEQIDRVAVVTLNRAETMNALSHDMVRRMVEWVAHCHVDRNIVALVMRGGHDGNFCAGSDMNDLYRLVMKSDAGWRQMLVDLYRLQFALRSLKKPVVALMDGVTAGSGTGLAQSSSLRVVTERTNVSLPETRLGFLSGIGAIRSLSDMPIEVALYLGLTGKTLTGPDTMRLGLADAYAPSASLSNFERRLKMLDLSDVRQSIRDVFISPADPIPDSGFGQCLPLIRAHFGLHLTVEEIVESMDRALDSDVSEQERGWLRASIDALLARSPLMLDVTREMLLRARSMSPEDCLRMEFDIAVRAIEVGDFCEGVRSILIDKDDSPVWMFRSLRDVNHAIVRKFFSPRSRAGMHPLANVCV